MEDVDLIARLYDATKPAFKLTEKAIRANASRYVAPQPQPPVTSHSPGSRASTEPPSEPVDDLELIYEPCLELRFSHGPNTNAGFVFGSAPNSDIVLPSFSGISHHHCTLTFDAENRPVIRDLDSMNGIIVSYDNEAKDQVRRDFTWIIGGHDVPQNKTIIVRLNSQIRFRVVVSRLDLTSPMYVKNVDKFRQGAASTDKILHHLNLKSRPRTELASGTRTPGAGPVVLKNVLGEGGFGVVYYAWNVSTGAEYALKMPSKKAIRERKVDLNAWRNEADIMGKISHENIVRLLGHETDVLPPHLMLEYFPLGSLADQEEVSVQECTVITRQGLSALSYLHGRGIVHRDITPDNILVRSRHQGLILIKLADFGLGKERLDPTSLVGTMPYIAPEVWIETGRRADCGDAVKKSYTPAVDLWSLGVVVSELIMPLLRCRAGGLSRCKKLADAVKGSIGKGGLDEEGLGEGNPGKTALELKQLLASMVTLDPKSRGSASECYQRAMCLPDEVDDNDETSQSPITPAPGPVEHESDQKSTLKGEPNEANNRRRKAEASLPESLARLRKKQKQTQSSLDEETSREGSSGSFHESWLFDALHP